MKNFFLAGLFVLLIDQITKFFIRTNFSLGESFPITNFFEITYITNTGAGFGIFSGQNMFLALFSIIVIFIILYYWKSIKKEEKIWFALIIGGIVGNVVDRLFFGYVIDFINFSFWPAFNVADSALVVSVAVLIINELKK